MEVIILAGGIGSRLQEVVNDVPKCMAKVAGHPFLKYLFDYLVPYCPSQVILSLGYKHEIVEEWVSSLSLPFQVTCVVENVPLGTGGAIKYALSAAKESDVVVINGDTFFDVNLTHLSDFHQQHDAELTLALKPMTDFNRYGSVNMEEKSGKILSFEEKKNCAKGLINGGIYIIRKNSTAIFPEKFSMENDFFPVKVRENNLYGCLSDGYFIDIGIPCDYEKAQNDFKDGIPNTIS